MKKEYQSPSSKAFALKMESVMASTSNPKVSSGTEYQDAADALTNKKSNPIWGDQSTENELWK